MTEEERKFDGVLMTILQQEKQIDSFFNRVFGFLRRNTDFFLNQKAAEDAITSTCKNNFDIFRKEQTQKQEQDALKKKRQQQRQKEKAKEKERPTPQSKTETIVTTPDVESKSSEAKTPISESKQDQKDEPAPKGNGGRTDKYIWTQTLEELHIYIPVKKDINKKLLTVKITPETLLVQQSGQPAIIDGKFHEKINAQDSIWLIEDGEMDDYKGKYIHFAIEKWKNQNSWWPTPIKGDAQINTQKINPQPSKLQDLEGDTKATVQKMMFDMRQKQMGLPSSDQLQKQDKLKDFMKAHPEMDFSKCKFN